ncbi:HlyU family transcriptional regulator [Jannaschia sp. M317]|uniref:HlyU family transcriptional regulator n=1 Tax=Jannaschia sp. M317 TaxID=2867011 RepID=UPI0021A5C65E|nr:HlyU family transcriptional regulator [Jannaschia sp. M317]UWQ17501.1 hypothetical protein K3551_16740 [Jannaschia sp. M317]
MAGFLSKLFGGGAPAAEPAVETAEYQGFKITPTPMKEGSEYRIAALIEKDGQSHQLIRADVMRDRDECATLSLGKAQQLIDQMGDRLFH